MIFLNPTICLLKNDNMCINDIAKHILAMMAGFKLKLITSNNRTAPKIVAYAYKVFKSRGEV